MQRQARHHLVERTWICELLDPYGSEDGTFGRPRIDGRHGMAGASKGVGQRSLPTTNLLQLSSWGINLVQDELLDTLPPHRKLTHETSLPTRGSSERLAGEPPGSPYPML